jgi:hypothetical protein
MATTKPSAHAATPLLTALLALVLGPQAMIPGAVGYPFEVDWSVIRQDQFPRVLQTSGGVRRRRVRAVLQPRKGHETLFEQILSSSLVTSSDLSHHLVVPALDSTSALVSATMLLLQTLPDLGQATQNCDALGGSRFFCDVHQKVGFETDYMNLNISIECFLDTTTGFDFRRASGCTCETLLTPSDPNRLPKVCPCSVCPLNFGSSSVSIDCSYLIANATNTTSNATETPVPASTSSPSPAGGGTGISSPAPSLAPAAAGGSVSLAPATTVAPAPAASSGGTGMPAGAPTMMTGSPAIRPLPTATATAGTTRAPPLSRGRVLQDSGTGNATSSTNSSAGGVPDPYIFDTCVSVDCAANCNGTCSLGCDSLTASSLCSFCEGAEGSPTPGPTGPAGGGGGGGGAGPPTIGKVSTSSATSLLQAFGAGSFTVGAAAIAMAVIL